MKRRFVGKTYPKRKRKSALKPGTAWWRNKENFEVELCDRCQRGSNKKPCGVCKKDFCPAHISDLNCEICDRSFCTLPTSKAFAGCNASSILDTGFLLCPRHALCSSCATRENTYFCSLCKQKKKCSDGVYFHSEKRKTSTCEKCAMDSGYRGPAVEYFFGVPVNFVCVFPGCLKGGQDK